MRDSARRWSMFALAAFTLGACATARRNRATTWYNLADPTRPYAVDYAACHEYGLAMAQNPIVSPRYRTMVYVAQHNNCMQARGWALVPQARADSLSAAYAAARQAAAQRAESNAGAGSAAPGLPSGDRLLFGGPEQKTFLGCLSCGRLDANSVFNELGEYGSRLRSKSIRNRLGEYGSPLSNFSVCNPLATEPPAIVDREGTFYGRLTLNRTIPGAVTDERVRAWLESFCAAA